MSTMDNLPSGRIGALSKTGNVVYKNEDGTYSIYTGATEVLLSGPISLADLNKYIVSLGNDSKLTLDKK